MRFVSAIYRLSLAFGLLATSLAAPRPRPSISLNGEWQFKLDPLDVGREQEWYKPGQPYDRTIPVPGAWNAQGVAFESEQHLHDYEQRLLNGRNLLGEERESMKLFHVYPGPGWYRKTVTIPADWQDKVPWLVFGGVHRDAEVWINGQPAAQHHSYLTPFRIDLSKFARAGDPVAIAVRVDARRNRDVDPLMGCMDTLDFLYVSWGGLHRPVMLEATEAIRIGELFVVPHLATSTAEIRISLDGNDGKALELRADVVDAGGRVVASAQGRVAESTNTLTLRTQIPNPKLWSPQSPHLYSARVTISRDETVMDSHSVRFGMREFKVADGKFLLNGKPIFLRGYGDDCIFPNTICPPADREAMRQRLRRAKDYGFNYVRHHSWTPPEEYLDAADELGMMLQPEFPFAYRWDLPTTPGAKRAALEQWEALIRLTRNHPSIVTWCMGNELYDSFDLAPDMYRIAKRLDPTRPVIDSDGSSFRHHERETLDFMVVQFNEGSSIGFGDSKYGLPREIRKPVVAHEMGYFVTLPDLAQLELFERGLRPYWLIQTRDLATRRGVLDEYPEWLAASYRLQAVCLKSNMEAARRSRLSGTSVWLFQDYPNCAEGVVDMFLRPKSLSPLEFQRFNAPTVLLVDLPRRNWWNDEAIDLRFVVSRFEDEASDDATLQWWLESEAGTLTNNLLQDLTIPSGGVEQLPSLRLILPPAAATRKLTLKAALRDAAGVAENSWDLWTFPRPLTNAIPGNVSTVGFGLARKSHSHVTELPPGPVPSATDVLVVTNLDDHVLTYLRSGGRVILLEPEPAFPTERTSFRLSSWDGGGPSGTVIDVSHPALAAMPSEGWCHLQFYHLIQGSRTMFLDELPGRIRPMIRCIDRPTRLANRAYLFEVRVHHGRLLVSGFNFTQALAMEDPAAVFFLRELIDYALGNDFSPQAELGPEALKISPRNPGTE
jgi:hypothetical protein